MNLKEYCSSRMSEWTPDYSIGHRLLDDQHKRILSICHRIDELACLQGKEYSHKYHALLNELFTYSDQHFKTEEDIFTQLNCPELEAHCQEHSSYIDKLMELNVAAMQGIMDARALRDFAVGWWTDHILHTDMKYKPYLEKCESINAF